jgi:hypothetical protein
LLAELAFADLTFADLVLADLAFADLVLVGLVRVSMGGHANDRAGGLASDTFAASRCTATDADRAASAAAPVCSADLYSTDSCWANSCWADAPQPGGGAIVSGGVSPPATVSLAVDKAFAEVSGFGWTRLRAGSREALPVNGSRRATSGRLGGRA